MHHAHVGVTVAVRSLPSPAPTWARDPSDGPTRDEMLHTHVGVTVAARSLPSPAPTWARDPSDGPTRDEMLHPRGRNRRGALVAESGAHVGARSIPRSHAGRDAPRPRGRLSIRHIFLDLSIGYEVTRSHRRRPPRRATRLFDGVGLTPRGSGAGAASRNRRRIDPLRTCDQSRDVGVTGAARSLPSPAPTWGARSIRWSHPARDAPHPRRRNPRGALVAESGAHVRRAIHPTVPRGARCTTPTWA